ncbi:hypothetical protein COOONC_28531 [Cooperia oncophora]
MEANFKHLHPECVVVQKGKDVSYGTEQIGAKMRRFFEENQPKNIKRSNATYCGWWNVVLCAVFVEVSFDTPNGPAKSY